MHCTIGILFRLTGATSQFDLFFSSLVALLRATFLRQTRISFQFIMAFTLGFITSQSCLAEIRFTVHPGDKITLFSSDKEINEKDVSEKNKQLQGKLIVSKDASSKIYRLEYIAPTAAGDITETVQYADGAENSAVVAVQGPSGSWGNDDIYLFAFKTIFILFVLATILESGLATIFNWRPFVYLFDSRGVKTIIAVLFAYMFVQEFKLDIISQLITHFKGEKFALTVPSNVITALVLAGGSSAVNNLLISLGFRSVKTVETITPRPAPTKAWISVHLIRKLAIGNVFIIAKSSTGAMEVVGTIAGARTMSKFASFFLRDYSRFPPSGGFTVQPGEAYEFFVEGKDAVGATISAQFWGPHAIAPGGIVDLQATL